MKCQSSGLTEEAWTRTNSSSSPTAGTSTSRSSRTSGEPYRSNRIAFTMNPIFRARQVCPRLRSRAYQGNGRGLRPDHHNSHRAVRPSRPRESHGSVGDADRARAALSAASESRVAPFDERLGCLAIIVGQPGPDVVRDFDIHAVA